MAGLMTGFSACVTALGEVLVATSAVERLAQYPAPVGGWGDPPSGWPGAWPPYALLDQYRPALPYPIIQLWRRDLDGSWGAAIAGPTQTQLGLGGTPVYTLNLSGVTAEVVDLGGLVELPDGRWLLACSRNGEDVGTTWVLDLATPPYAIWSTEATTLGTLWALSGNEGATWEMLSAAYMVGYARYVGGFCVHPVGLLQAGTVTAASQWGGTTWQLDDAHCLPDSAATGAGLELLTTTTPTGNWNNGSPRQTGLGIDPEVSGPTDITKGVAMIGHRNCWGGSTIPAGARGGGLVTPWQELVQVTYEGTPRSALWYARTDGGGTTRVQIASPTAPDGDLGDNMQPDILALSDGSLLALLGECNSDGNVVRQWTSGDDGATWTEGAALEF